MCPILFRVEIAGSVIAVPAYGLAMALAVLSLVLVAWRLAVRRSLPSKSALGCALVAALMLMVGSRLAYWVVDPLARQSGASVLWRPVLGGLVLPGGMAAAALALFALCRATRLCFWSMLDAFAPAFGVAGIFLRIGCFLNGCCYGRETDVSWGVVFPPGSRAHLEQASRQFDLLFTSSHPVHPTQLYELAAGLMAVGLTVWLMRRGARPGVPALAGLQVFHLFRWMNRGLRAGEPWLPWPWYHLTQAVVALAILAMLLVRLRSGARSDGLVEPSAIRPIPCQSADCTTPPRRLSSRT